MANYSELIATINDQIKANGNQEITGPVLNAVLQAMVSALGEGYQFMGVATPDTNPGTPDGKVFYIATEPGTYSKFGDTELKKGIGFFTYDSNGWTFQSCFDLSTLQNTQIMGTLCIFDNMFNPDEVIDGKYIFVNNGELYDSAEAAVSGIIPVIPGNFYRLVRDNNIGATEVRFLGKDGVTPIKPQTTGGVQYPTYATSQSPMLRVPANAFFVQFTCKFDGIDCGYNSSYLVNDIDDTGYKPYDPYSKVLNPIFLPNNLGLLGVAESINLLIKTSPKILTDKLISVNGIISLEGYYVSAPIKLKAGVPYKGYRPYSVLGTNVSAVKVTEEGTFLSTFSMTTDSSSNTVWSYTPDEDMFIRLNMGNDKYLQMAFFCEEAYYNQLVGQYEQGGYFLSDDVLLNKAQIEQLDNYVLKGKRVAFDGDSIVDGVSTDSWAPIIISKYHMKGTNYAVSGGTITKGTQTSGGVNRHWVSANIDNIISQNASLDYLILEGGTNDADLNTQFELGTFDEADFTGPFDNTTFYGALDYLFKKAIEAYPTAKIGFVIAMKMGTTPSTLNNRRQFFGYIIKSCQKWGIPYLDLWQDCQMNPNLSVYYDSSLSTDENVEQGKFYRDGQHPTNVGYDYLTPIVAAWMAKL